MIEKAADTESRETMLVEFEVTGLSTLPPDPAIQKEIVRRLPGGRRDALTVLQAQADLADCLFEQVALLKSLKRFSDGAPRVAEAVALFERLGDYRRVADCFRLAADVHRELGEAEIALEFRRREEELRRRLAA